MSSASLLSLPNANWTNDSGQIIIREYFLVYSDANDIHISNVIFIIINLETAPISERQSKTTIFIQQHSLTYSCNSIVAPTV